MATQKSIVQVDVESDQFKEFMALFEKYKVLLDKIPKQWQKVDEAVVDAGEDAEETFDKQIAKLKIIHNQTQNVSFNLTQHATHINNTNRSLNYTAKVTKSIAKNVANTTWHLLKWAALGGLAGAAGGVWGLDRLASSATNVRTTSRNLGATPGELNAARVNYGGYFDAQGVLGNINNVQSSLASSWLLSGMGLDTNQSAGRLLPQLIPKLLDRYRLAGGKREIYEAQGLGQLMDFNDVRGLSRLPAGEVSKLGAQYSKDAGTLGIGDNTLSAWQRLGQQFDRAGVQIQNTLITGLANLTPHLEAFSRGIVNLVTAFANNPKMGEWVNAFGQSLEGAAKYLASEQFKNKVTTFLTALDLMAQGVLRVAHFLGVGGDNSAPKQVYKGVNTFWSLQWHPIDAWRKLIGGPPHDPSFSGKVTYAYSSPRHNPGNLRPANGVGFRSFGSEEEGLRAMADQLRRYQDVYGLNTISGIVSRYAPPGENNTAAYIANVAARTKYKPGQPLDLHDNATLANVMAAMTKQENSRSPYTAGGIQVVIQNQTGGSAIATASQLAR